MTRESLLSHLPKHSIGVEVGVFKGEFSEVILKLVQPSLLLLVDPWCGRIGSGDKHGENMSYIDGDTFFKDSICRRFGSNPNVRIARATSAVLAAFPDDYFDWCYIDGDHSYDGVRFDLNILHRKVRHGGFLLGHDYKTSRFPGVVRAVDEFCKERSTFILHLTDDGCPSYMIPNNKLRKMGGASPIAQPSFHFHLQ